MTLKETSKFLNRYATLGPSGLNGIDEVGTIDYPRKSMNTLFLAMRFLLLMYEV